MTILTFDALGAVLQLGAPGRECAQSEGIVELLRIVAEVDLARLVTKSDLCRAF